MADNQSHRPGILGDIPLGNQSEQRTADQSLEENAQVYESSGAEYQLPADSPAVHEQLRGSSGEQLPESSSDIEIPEKLQSPVPVGEPWKSPVPIGPPWEAAAPGDPMAEPVAGLPVPVGPPWASPEASLTLAELHENIEVPQDRLYDYQEQFDEASVSHAQLPAAASLIPVDPLPAAPNLIPVDLLPALTRHVPPDQMPHAKRPVSSDQLPFTIELQQACGSSAVEELRVFVEPSKSPSPTEELQETSVSEQPQEVVEKPNAADVHEVNPGSVGAMEESKELSEQPQAVVEQPQEVAEKPTAAEEQEVNTGSVGVKEQLQKVSEQPQEATEKPNAADVPEVNTGSVGAKEQLQKVSEQPQEATEKPNAADVHEVNTGSVGAVKQPQEVSEQLHVAVGKPNAADVQEVNTGSVDATEQPQEMSETSDMALKMPEVSKNTAILEQPTEARLAGSAGPSAAGQSLESSSQLTAVEQPQKADSAALEKLKDAPTILNISGELQEAAVSPRASERNKGTLGSEAAVGQLQDKANPTEVEKLHKVKESPATVGQLQDEANPTEVEKLHKGEESPATVGQLQDQANPTEVEKLHKGEESPATVGQLQDEANPTEVEKLHKVEESPATVGQLQDEANPTEVEKLQLQINVQSPTLMTNISEHETTPVKETESLMPMEKEQKIPETPSPIAQAISASPIPVGQLRVGAVGQTKLRGLVRNVQQTGTAAICMDDSEEKRLLDDSLVYEDLTEAPDDKLLDSDSEVTRIRRERSACPVMDSSDLNSSDDSVRIIEINTNDDTPACDVTEAASRDSDLEIIDVAMCRDVSNDGKLSAGDGNVSNTGDETNSGAENAQTDCVIDLDASSEPTQTDDVTRYAQTCDVDEARVGSEESRQCTGGSDEREDAMEYTSRATSEGIPEDTSQCTSEEIKAKGVSIPHGAGPATGENKQNDINTQSDVTAGCDVDMMQADGGSRDRQDASLQPVITMSRDVENDGLVDTAAGGDPTPASIPMEPSRDAIDVEESNTSPQDGRAGSVGVAMTDPCGVPGMLSESADTPIGLSVTSENDTSLDDLVSADHITSTPIRERVPASGSEGGASVSSGEGGLESENKGDARGVDESIKEEQVEENAPLSKNPVEMTSDEKSSAGKSNSAKVTRPDIEKAQGAQVSSTDVVIELAKRAALRQQAESQAEQQYTKCDVILLRVLDAANFKMAPDDRQIDAESVDAALAASGVGGGGGREVALREGMMASLRKVLSLPAQKFRCPHTDELGTSSECLYKNYSYMGLVLHMLVVHRCTFGHRRGSAGARIVHGGAAYGCDTCGFGSQHVLQFLEHVRQHAEHVPPYRCSTCDVTFSAHEATEHFKDCADARTGNSFELHFGTDTADLLLRHRFLCPLCDKAGAFYALGAYILHISEHSNFSISVTDPRRRSYYQYDKARRLYLCKACDFQTALVDAFMEHLRCHLATHPYKCLKCNCLFRTTTDFKDHVTGCGGGELGVDESYRSQMEDTLHMIYTLHATAVQKPALDDDDVITYYDCVTHGFQTANYIAYLQHLVNFHEDFTKVNRTVSKGGNNTIAFKDGRYYCSGCNLATPLRIVFQEHMRCHTLSLPYRCMLCNKDLASFVRPHAPCHVLSAIVVKPSPAMESVMQKLGPMAPPTSKAEELGFPGKKSSDASAHGSPGRKSGKRLSQVVDKLAARVSTSDSPGTSCDPLTSYDSLAAKARDVVRTSVSQGRPVTSLKERRLARDRGAHEVPARAPGMAAPRAPGSVLIGQDVAKDGTVLRDHGNPMAEAKEGRPDSVDAEAIVAAMGYVYNPKGFYCTRCKKLYSGRSGDDVQRHIYADTHVTYSAAGAVCEYCQYLANKEHLCPVVLAVYKYLQRVRDTGYAKSRQVAAEITGAPSPSTGEPLGHGDPPLGQARAGPVELPPADHSRDLSRIVEQDAVESISGPTDVPTGRSVAIPVSADQSPTARLYETSQQPTKAVMVVQPVTSHVTAAPVTTRMALEPVTAHGHPAPFHGAADTDVTVVPSFPHTASAAAQPATSHLIFQPLVNPVDTANVVVAPVASQVPPPLVATLVPYRPAVSVVETAVTTSVTSVSQVTAELTPQVAMPVVTGHGNLEPVTAHVSTQPVAGDMTSGSVSHVSVEPGQSKEVKQIEASEQNVKYAVTVDTAKSDGILTAGGELKNTESKESLLRDEKAGRTDVSCQSNTSQSDGRKREDLELLKSKEKLEECKAEEMEELKESKENKTLKEEIWVENKNFSRSIGEKKDVQAKTECDEKKISVEEEIENINEKNAVSKEKKDKEYRRTKNKTENRTDGPGTSVEEKTENDEAEKGEGGNKDEEETEGRKETAVGAEKGEFDDERHLVSCKSLLKCDIKDGRYTCYDCSFSTYNGKSFKHHLWKHTHKKVMQCSHVPPHEVHKMQKCPIILGLVQLLVMKTKGMALPSQDMVLYEEKLPEYYATEENDGSGVEEEVPESTGEENDGLSSLVITDVYGGVQDITMTSVTSSEDMSQDSPASAAEPAEQAAAIIYQCAQPGCSFSTNEQSEFLEHCKGEHADARVFPCKCCKKTGFMDPLDLALHISQRLQDKQKYNCGACSFSTAKLQTFERHLHKRHTGEEAYICSYCDVTHASIEALLEHLRQKVLKVFKCPYCEETFHAKRRLVSHSGTFHPGLPRKITMTTVATCKEGDRAAQDADASQGEADPPDSSSSSIAPGPEPQQGHAQGTNQSVPEGANTGKAASVGVGAAKSKRQNSESETSASRLECPSCDFLCWSKAQMESHVMWHEDSSLVRKAPFLCPHCPCAVTDFSDIRFHLQFHKRESKIKYYECASCPYRSNVEDSMESHHRRAHVGGRDSDDSSGDEEATYMVKKLKVAFHNGRYTCPKDACAEAFEQILALQEHCVQQHGHPLADKHRLDFYTATSRHGGDEEDGVAASLGRYHGDVRRGQSKRSGDRPAPAARDGDVFGGAAVAQEFAAVGSIDAGDPFLHALTQVKTEPCDDMDDVMGDDMTALVTKHHCELCNFNTNDQNELLHHIQGLHRSEAMVDSLMQPGVTSEEYASEYSDARGDRALRPATSGPFRCSICPYSTTIRKTYNIHMNAHRKFENNYTGSAYKCGYCPYMCGVKGPAANHLKNLHADRDVKLLFVQMKNSIIVHQTQVAIKYKKPAAAAAATSSTATPGSPSPSSSSSATAAATAAVEATVRDIHAQQMAAQSSSGKAQEREATRRSDSEAEPAHQEDDSEWGATVTRRSSGEIPDHQDPDWFVDLTKEEAAFCNKVSGLRLYQCKLCPHMAESSAAVRCHYVSAHADSLPVLCGYCRERCDADSYRKHHENAHPEQSVKMIRLVLRNGPSKHLDLLPGETEIEEVIDDRGQNDWLAALRDLVVMEASGALLCKFCHYRHHTMTSLKRHVFPQHFKCYPFVCQYCQVGMSQMTLVKSHMEKLHPEQPVRVRKPLPVTPSEQEIQALVEAAPARPVSRGPAGHSPRHHSPRIQSPPGGSSRSGHHVTSKGTRSRSGSTSPARSRSLHSPFSPGGSFLDPNKVKQEKVDPDLSTSSEELLKGVKKIYKCYYCSDTSKWTAKDVQRHILTSHLGLKLFNCVYCEFGCYSRGRLESHCAERHPRKPCKVSTLDRRMNRIYVISATDDGVDVLALFKPDGEPVLSLEAHSKSQLRKFTLATKQTLPPNTSAREGEEESQGMIAFKGQRKTKASKMSAAQRGKMMTSSIKDNVKCVYVCRLCSLVLDKVDRMKYHVICHHWKLRPYKCPVCDVYKYQREPTRQHITDAHGDSELQPVYLCDLRHDELNASIRRVTNPAQIARLTEQSRSVGGDPETVPGGRSKSVTSETSTNEEEAGLPQEELWQCLEARCGIVAPYRAVQNHVLVTHLQSQVYLCGFCEATSNDAEDILGHLNTSHPNMPQRFSHTYGKFKDEVDALIGRYTEPIQSPTSFQFRDPTSDTSSEFRAPDGSYRVGTGTPDMGGRVRTPQNATTNDGQPSRPSPASVPCPICQVRLKNQSDIDWHLAEQHPQYVKYQCGYCDVISETEQELKGHMVQSHSDKPPEYSVLRNLTANLTDGAGGKACRLCAFVTDSNAVLYEHMEGSHLNQVLFQCKLCAGLHKTKDDLMTHYGVLHRDDPLQYKVVPLGTEDDDDDDDEIEDNEDDADDVTKGLLGDVYDCDYCAYTSRDAVELKRHLLMHGVHSAAPEQLAHDSSAANSNGQKKKQARKSSQSTHTSANQSEADGHVSSYACAYCSYVTRDRAGIRRHVMTHVNYQPYVCPLCDVTAVTSNQIKSHVEGSHKGQKASPLLRRDAQKEAMVQQGIRRIREPAGGAGEVSGSGAARRRLDEEDKLEIVKRENPQVHKILSSLPKNIKCENTSADDRRSRDRMVVKEEKQSAAKAAGDVRGSDAVGAVSSPRARFACKLCEYSTNSSIACISRHVRVHLKYKKFRCPHCGFAAAQRGAITSHLSKQHPKLATQVLIDTDAAMERRVEECYTKSDDVMWSSPPPAKRQASPTRKVKTPNTATPADAPGGQGVDGSASPPPPPPLPPPPPPPPPAQPVRRGVTFECKLCDHVVVGFIHRMRRHLRTHFNYKKYTCPYCDFSDEESTKVTQHVAKAHVGKQVRYVTSEQPQLERKMEEYYVRRDGRSPSKSPTKQLTDGASKPVSGSHADHGTDHQPPPSCAQPLPGPGAGADASGGGEAPAGGSAQGGAGGRGVTKYQCLICKAYSSNLIQHTRNHVMSHINYKKFRCGYCEMKMVQRSSMLQHVRNMHKDQPLTVLVEPCAELEAKLEASIVKIKENPTLATTAKKKSFKVVQSLAKKYTSAVKMKPRSNPGKPSVSPIKIKVENSTGGSVYSCKLCGFVERSSTPRTSNIRRHVMAHLNYQRYKCPYCDFSHYTTYSVKKHAQRHHPGRRATFEDRKDNELEAIVNKNVIKEGGSRPSLCFGSDDQREGSRSENEHDTKARSKGERTRSRSESEQAARSRTASEADTEGKEEGEIGEGGMDDSSEVEKKPGLGKRGQGQGDYQCLACRKRAPHLSVMTRHIACHLHYRRYGCPHCSYSNVIRTNALRHVSEKHPGRDKRVVDNKDAAMESRIQDYWVNLKDPDAQRRIASAESLMQDGGGGMLAPVPKPATSGVKRRRNDSGGKQRSVKGRLGTPEADADVTRSVKGRPGTPEADADVTRSVKGRPGTPEAAADVTRAVKRRPGTPEAESGSSGEEPTGKPLAAKGRRASTSKDKKGDEASHSAPASPPRADPIGDGAVAMATEAADGDGDGLCFRCVRCGYETEHRASMQRHLMWKLGYKPYHCGHCPYRDVVQSGLHKHLARKHKGKPASHELQTDEALEAEVDELLSKSTVRIPAKRKASSDSPTSQPDTDGEHNSKKIRLESGEMTSSTQPTANQSVDSAPAGQGRSEPEIIHKGAEFEYTVFERTPVRIPKRHSTTGQYTCLYCQYTTSKTQNIRCHILNQHEPAHWRCDHCHKAFSMLYKLRKHTTTTHKLPLRYTNTVTGEMCVDDVIVCAGSSPQRTTPSPGPVVDSRSRSPHAPESTPPPIKADTPAGRATSTGTRSPEPSLPRSPTRSNDDADRLSTASGASGAAPEASVTLRCHQCGYTTEAEVNLLAHLLTHKRMAPTTPAAPAPGKKVPVACPLCPYASARPGDLQVHARKHVLGRPYQCEHCALTFKLRAQVTSHAKRKHPDLPVKVKLADKTVSLKRIERLLQPRVPLSDFMTYSIEQLHTLMVDNALKEIHQ